MGFSGDDVTIGGVLFLFWPTLPGPGLQLSQPIHWLKICSETRRKSASLEPLKGFLAYL